MSLIMVGLDYKTTPIDLREKFSFTEKSAKEFITKIYNISGVNGCVLISTCNRTELYLSVKENYDICPQKYLLDFADVNISDMKGKFFYKTDDELILYLMEIACGLHSQIIHEEQIVTQIRQSISLARSCNTTDAILDTLFRIAVSAGKYAQTNVIISNVPLSLSYSAIQMLEQKYNNNLSGKKCVIIGNGKMGQLASDLLIKRNCCVYITLRTYHNVENIIPDGTIPISYDKRFSEIDNADIVISATRSPHYTITENQLKDLNKKPDIIIDLALPRDIEESCNNLSGVEVWNLDYFKNNTETDNDSVKLLYQISQQYADMFHMWFNYRNAIPYIQQLKKISYKRIINSSLSDNYKNNYEFEEIVHLVTDKTIDMIMGSIKSEITPNLIKECCKKISDRSRLKNKRY